MSAMIERQMYKFAKIYANKMNGKTGYPILDQKFELPRDIINAGGWFGFIAGFRFCLQLLTMTGITDNDDTTNAAAETTSNNSAICPVQNIKKTTS